MKKVITGLLLLMVIASGASADTIVPTTGAGWRTWTVADQSGTPYWNGNSSDFGIAGNIGNYINSTQAFSGSGLNLGNLKYWGMSSGAAAPLGITFAPDGQTNFASMLLEVAGNANNNEFGYYYTGAHYDGLHTLFAGSATAGATALFAPTHEYGFYLKTVTGNTFGVFNRYVFDTQELGEWWQHFAIFDDTKGGFIIGMEDIERHGDSDRDYNDMVVRFANVPEPATLLLLGFGLIGMAGYARRRQQG